MSGTSNPFQAFVERRLLRAFLRSGSTTIYEETLGVSSDASPDSIRAAYKAASLRLHPDKIRQLHGRDPTEEEKKSLLVAKDAYQVLSDSVRRQKYKDLGHVGMKMSEGVFEDGVQHMGAVLVRNFRSNSQDRDLLLFLLLLALVDVVAAPIVFCLKADGTGAVGRTPWTVIWIPMWIYNFFLLVAAISNLVTSPRSRASNHASDSGSVSGSAGGGSESGEHDSSAHLLSLEDINPFKYERNFVHRLVDFFCTTSLVTAQVFITMMMDGDLPSWTWAQVFIPVYIYEACWCWKYLYRSLNTREEPQEIIAYRARSHSPVEDPQAAGEADLAHMKLLEYFQHNELCANAREQLFLLMFWIWQTIFLMVYFDGRVDWAWGLILLPAWVYLFARAVLVYSGYHAAKRIRAGLDLDAIAIGLDRDIEHHARAAHGERVHATATAMMCCTAPFLYFFVMLVCTLRGDNISTFWIFVPVWVWVAILLSLSCCLCCVLTVCNLEASAADTENMPVPVHADATATSNTQSTPIVVAYEPPTLPVQTMPSTAVSAVPIDSRGIAIVVRDSDDLD